MTGYTARRIARRIRPFGLALALPDSRRRTYGSGPMATLTGAASELLLYLGGRRATAQVTLSGDADAIAAVERADLKV